MKGLLFTYGLTYGGAAVSLFNPFIGLLIYICFATIRPEFLWFWSVPQANHSRIVAICLLLGWALRGFGNWRFGRGNATTYSFATLMIWALLSSMQAANPAVCAEFLEKLAKIFLPFLVGMTLIDSLHKLKQLAWVIVISQGYVAYELNLAYLTRGAEFLAFFRETGFGSMDNNCVSIAMATGVGFALFLGFGAPKWWQKLIAFGCVLLMAHVILFSFSRGGMIALILSSLMAFWLLPKRTGHYLVFALIVVLGIRLAGDEVQVRLMSSFASEDNLDDSAKSRTLLWKDCVDVMVKYPLFGLGPDYWPQIAHEYGWPPGKEAHSLWLQIGAEMGAVGLFLFLLFYAITILRLWPLARSKLCEFDPWYPMAARMVITALIGFMISAQFVSLKFLELPYYVALFGAGVLKLTSVHNLSHVHSPESLLVPASMDLQLSK